MLITAVLGFGIVLLSAVFFCFQNVVVRILFNQQTIFGAFHTGGFVTPTLPHSFLLLFMRMLLVVPLMALLAPKLYPATWNRIGQLWENERPLLRQAVGAGFLMFLYLALLYISIGLIPTGIATTLFFTYPVFTALFSWRLFGERLTLLRWSVIGLVFLGSFLTIPYVNTTTNSNHLIGSIAGIASGITYALYTVIAQKSFGKLHPVPFTWISFATTLVLAATSLLFWNIHDTQLPWLPLWIGGLLSALFTFVGHLMNNFGIRLIGATSASMVAASNPALTVVLAWLTIQETLNSLQLTGIIIVTLSVALLSREHTRAK